MDDGRLSSFPLFIVLDSHPLNALLIFLTLALQIGQVRHIVFDPQRACPSLPRRVGGWLSRQHRDCLGSTVTGRVGEEDLVRVRVVDAFERRRGELALSDETGAILSRRDGGFLDRGDAESKVGSGPLVAFARKKDSTESVTYGRVANRRKGRTRHGREVGRNMLRRPILAVLARREQLWIDTGSKERRARLSDFVFRDVGRGGCWPSLELLNESALRRLRCEVVSREVGSLRQGRVHTVQGFAESSEIERWRDVLTVEDD